MIIIIIMTCVVALATDPFGWHYFSNTALFYALFFVSRIIKICYTNYSQRLKKACVRQVVIDKSYLPCSTPL